MAKARLAEIDGLRGIAAVSVMCGHWAEFIRLQSSPAGWSVVLSDIFLRYFSFGRTGIVAFFCVSGFLVPFSFRGAYPLVAFPLSRFFRLYPAYWTSIFAAVIILTLTHEMDVTVRQVLVNMSMLQLLTKETHLLGVYWTLTIELMFYTICYALFALSVLHNARVNFVAMCFFVAVAVAGGAWRWTHPASGLPIGVPTYLAAMHFGTIVRLHTLEHVKMSRRLYPVALVLLLTGVLTANTLAYYNAQNELVGWVAADVGYVAGVALFLLAIERKMFSGRVCAYLGLISYSVYLFHMAIIRAVSPLFTLFGSWEMNVLVWTPVYFSVTYVVAAVVQRMVEQPSIKLGRSVDRAIERLLERTRGHPDQADRG